MSSAAQAQLKTGFYSSSCPSAEAIVRSTVESYFNKDPTIASGLLRLHFHDCFVQGCDGLDEHGLVKLVGAHTVGQTKFRFFSYRLYNFTTTGNSDPTENQAFLAQLQALCPQNGNGLKRVSLDKDSSAKFDVSFFKNVRDGNGLLESDQRLWGDSATRSVVQSYAGNIRGLLGLRFSFEFPKAMIKLSSIEVRTGTEGEIRKACSKFNSY